jgi:acetoin utilization protein AcuB
MIIAKSLMNKKVVTVLDTSLVVDAEKLMQKYQIRHLPVMNQEGRLMGMLTDRDTNMALNFNRSNETEKHRVEHFMSWPIHTIDENTSVQEVAQIMNKEKVSALVVNAPACYIKGIITTHDILQYLIDLLDTQKVENKVYMSDKSEVYPNHSLQ